MRWTFERVAQAYLERYAKVRKRTWREDERILAHDVLPRWCQRPARAITPRDVRRLLDAIVDRGAPIQANRTLALDRYGYDREKREALERWATRLAAIVEGGEERGRAIGFQR